MTELQKDTRNSPTCSPLRHPYCAPQCLTLSTRRASKSAARTDAKPSWEETRNIWDTQRRQRAFVGSIYKTHLAEVVACQGHSGGVSKYVQSTARTWPFSGGRGGGGGGGTVGEESTVTIARHETGVMRVSVECQSPITSQGRRG